MRALTISANGGLDQLEYRTDLPIPEPGAGEVRIRVTAAALNHLDLFVLAGLPGVKISPKWVMGADATGVIDTLGPGVDSVRAGETVIVNPGLSDGTCEYCKAGEQSSCVNFQLLGEHRSGTMAEYIVVPAKNVRSIPKSIPPESAAAFSLATLTAWRMVHTRARVKKGEHVLIQGIGGGVAIAALQICKQIGANVWVTSSSDEKLEKAQKLGADHTLNNRSTDVAKEIRVRTNKRGVDAVIDSVGEATWNSSLGALAKQGRLVTCGVSSGPKLETDGRRLFWNQWDILGSTMGNDAEFDAIAAELRKGNLLPPVDSVFGLEKGRDAFARLQKAEQFGKVVVKISE
ncbi:MAG: zinc-binding dehydrogenase [Gemmatimonadaceae bacterium]|nr:zinc-binding dehydrogenase [Gemmatimonadaceae bacterium]